jgi:hypothetical protein
VNTSIFTAALAVHVDAPRRPIDAADRIFDHRHQQQLTAAHRRHLEHLAGRQRKHPHDRTEHTLSVSDLEPLQLVRPELTVAERRSVTAGCRELMATHRLRRRAAGDALDAHDRVCVGSCSPHNRRIAAIDLNCHTKRQHRRERTRHIEAAVETVRSTNAPNRQTLAVPRGRWIAQSTMSTST